MRYSDSTGMFYGPGALFGVPEDAREITESERQAILAAAAPPLPPLTVRAAAALVQIDEDTDRIYDDTIGSRGEEYRQAEADAHAFKAANYEPPVPAFVADHLAAKQAQGWTAQQACDDILATAAMWRNAQAAIRANRLLCKELCRQAQDDAALAAALGQWSAFVSLIRSALGLSQE